LEIASLKREVFFVLFWSVYFVDTQIRLKVENLLAKYALFPTPYTCSIFASLGNFIVHFDNIIPFLSIFGTLCLPFIYWYFLEARGGIQAYPAIKRVSGRKIPKSAFFHSPC
jgi:hypothetical protein